MKNVYPNLPESNVKSAFISEIMPSEIKTELEKFGVIPVEIPHTNGIQSELRYHPDIITYNILRGKWLVERDFVGFSVDLGIEVCKTDVIIGEKYPDDTVFNCITVNGKSLCGSKNKTVFAENTIRIGQGYVKCSTVCVDADSFITQDVSVYKALLSENKNVLLIDIRGEILLNGFDYGFIGGCCGKISKDIIAFTGKVNELKCYEEIKSFCKNCGVYIMNLSNNKLYDYGGILPITEV